MIPPAGTEPYIVNKRDRLRAFVLVFACVVALVLNCVGTGYQQIIPKTVNNGYYISLWWIYQCVAGACGPRTDMINYGSTCSELSNPFRAAEAFVVSADIILGIAVIYALLEYFAVVSRVIGVILAIIFVVFDTVAWAIVIAIYNRQTCGTTLAYQHDVDVGLDLLVASTALVFMAIVFWFIRFCCWSGDCCTNRYTAQPVQFVAPAAAPVAAPAFFAPSMYTPVARVA